MIQDIAPHIFHNEFHERESRPDDRVTVFAGGKTYLTQAGVFPTAEEIKALGAAETDLVYLFEIDQTAFFLLWNVSDAVKHALAEHVGMVFRNMKPTYLALPGATAMHLSAWYRSNRFCGRCGAAMARDKVERAMRCPQCDQVVYPRINPAVLAAVRHRDKLLLTHYANRPNATRYALVAGFTEIGETLEDTVLREVMEEVGLPIQNIRYHASQPWGFAGNLMVGFWADLDCEDETITLDHNELDEGVWLSREEIPVDPNPASLTHTMIQLFREGKDPR